MRLERGSARWIFWKIAIKPGKPLAFGRVCGKPFIGAPDNRVSLFVTFRLFARTFLLKTQGITDGLLSAYRRCSVGAEVILSQADGVVAGQAMSDREGRFRLPVAAGVYRMKVFRDEYAPVQRDGIQVGAEAVEVIEVRIEITPAAIADDQAPPESGCN